MDHISDLSTHNNPTISYPRSRDEVHNARDTCPVIETVFSRAEEALVDCSQCLKIVKDLRPELLETYYSEEDSECYDLRRKLQDEKERHAATRDSLAAMSHQLETCKKDLYNAEEERTVALVYNTELEALRSKLSAKEQEALDLSSELQARERELRLKDKSSNRSSHGEISCKRCSSADTTLPSGQSIAQEVVQVSRRMGPQQNFLLGACKEAEKAYGSELAELHREVQSLEQAVKEADRVCMQVREAYESKISHCMLRHIDISHMSKKDIAEPTVPEPVLHSNDMPSPNTASLEVMLPQGVAPPSNIVGGGGSTTSAQLDVLNVSPVPNPASLEIMQQQGVGLHSDIVNDSISTAPASHHMDGLQLDIADSYPVPKLSTVGLKSLPQQGVGSHLDIVGDGGSTAFVQPGVLNPNPAAEFVLPQAMHFRLYAYYDWKLIFLLSTIVAFIAVVSQYELGPEMLHRGTGCIRPGWAHHRNEGKRKALAG